MTNKERKEALREIAEHYGRENQLEMLIEECAELIQAVQRIKHSYDGISGNNFIEELADVKVMLGQIEFLLYEDEADIFGRCYDYKLERQLERMKEGD